MDMRLTFEKAKRLRKLRGHITDLGLRDIDYVHDRIDDILENLVPKNNGEGSKGEIQSFLNDYSLANNFHVMKGTFYAYKDSTVKVGLSLGEILKDVYGNDTLTKKYLQKVINAKLKELFGEEMFKVIARFTLEHEELENGVRFYLSLLFK